MINFFSLRFDNSFEFLDTSSIVVHAMGDLPIECLAIERLAHQFCVHDEEEEDDERCFEKCSS